MIKGYWKLGTNWGTKAPDFLSLLVNNEIVISHKSKVIPDKGEVVVIAQGHNVVALADVIGEAKKVTQNDSFKSGFKEYEIEYSDDVFYAEAEIYLLEKSHQFKYKLQQGITKIDSEYVIDEVDSKIHYYRQRESFKQDFIEVLEKSKYANSTVLTYSSNAIRATSFFFEKGSINSSLIYAREVSEIEKFINVLGNHISGGFKGLDFKGVISFIPFLKEICLNQKKKINSMVKNTILYGPPGTGKTYLTTSKALSICGVDTENLPRENQKDLFNNKVLDGQVVFTTFHQSLSYEDFIEGIKPIEPEKDGDDVIYKVEDGLFKKLSIEASFELLRSELSTSTETVLDFSASFDEFAEWIEEGLTKEENIELKTKNGGVILVDGISQQGNILLKHKGKDKLYTVSKQRLSKLNSAFPDLKEIKNIDQEFRSVIGGNNATANWSVLNAIRANSKKKKTFTKTQFSWEEKVEVVKNAKFEDYKGKIGRPYVLVIDEINRGNVSQIFGELITLLEDDKRLGTNDVTMVTLPYSKEKFGVPPNLFIIGTMNTADRSVEALDTALRRRFSFEEMLPSSKTITEDSVSKGNINGINLASMLDTINQRIEVLIDRDHTIGHAFFMNVDSLEGLKAVFADKIIPLLQEYFYNDYHKMELILGSGFFKTFETSTVEFPVDTELVFDSKEYKIKNVKGMKESEFKDALIAGKL